MPVAAAHARASEDPAGHFAAFSFVDRITEFVPGTRARGCFAIPATLPAFPACLVAEATGQLAAWAAMAHIAFRGRPVAALANETRFLAEAAPGQTLELAVDIEHCDDEAVAYRGQAHAGGVALLELVDCLGPMLPVAQFDSPEALAARLDLLRTTGAPPGRFHGVVAPRVVAGECVPGQSLTATLHVPKAAPFFADHFPRRPVYPATLLLDHEIRLALDLAATAAHWPAGARPRATRLTHVKMREFMPPGSVLEVKGELAPQSAGTAIVRLSTRMDGKQVATARLEIVARAPA